VGLLLVSFLTGCGAQNPAAVLAPTPVVLTATPALTTPEAVVAQAFDLLASGDTVSLEALCSTNSGHSVAEIVYAMQQAWNYTHLRDPALDRDPRVGPVISRTIVPAEIHGKTAMVEIDFVHQQGTSIWQADLRQSDTGWTIDHLTTRSTTPRTTP
jgi:hypothetical protein